MTETEPRDAPWFYRRRFIMFGVLYAAAFFVGFMIMGLPSLPAVPVFRYSLFPNAMTALAVVLVLAGFALRVWASSFFAPDVVSGGNPQAAQLNVSGPYRFTRNPLYLGNVLQGVGIAIVTPWVVSLLVIAGVFVMTHALIRIEEPFLAKTQGEAFERYRSAVARLIPLPWKIAPPGNQPASLREGLQTEATIGLIAVIMFAIALVNDVWLPYPGR